MSDREAARRTGRDAGQRADPDATQAIPAPAQPDAAPDRSNGPSDDATQAILAPAQPDSAPDRSDGRSDDATRTIPQATDSPAALPPPVLPPPGRGRGSGSTSRRSGQRPPRRPRTRTRGRGRKVRRVLVVLLLVWIAFLIAVPIWAWSRIERVDAEPDGDRPADQDGTTYLVVGSDSREGLDADQRQQLATGSVEGQRTDTIMLLHTGSEATVLLSLPRDSPVEIPGEGSNKINAAYSIGGPELLVETVEASTGIRVDGYIEIGLGGFASIVDSLGGVEVCPDQAIRDRLAGLDIEAGCQELDGPDALGYARTRDFATADLQRVQNQREVVGAIGDKALSPWTVLNPWRYFQVAAAGGDALRIGEDVGPIDLVRFAWAMGGISGGGLTCTVPLAGPDATWDSELAPQLFALIAEDRTDEISDDLCRSSGL